MNLSHRLQALERLAGEQGLDTAGPPCAACGGPGRNQLGVILVDVTSGELLRHCTSCGRVVNQQGRAIGHRAVVLFLHDRQDDGPVS